MRRDIAKVVFERPKSGRTWVSKTPRAAAVVTDPAGEQVDEGSNHVRRKRQKMRNRNRGPLRHLLPCRVGRPWDQVWREVCGAADCRSALGSEIRESVEYLVATNCWFEGRRVMSASRCGAPGGVGGLYVDPRSGLLMQAREDR